MASEDGGLVRSLPRSSRWAVWFLDWYNFIIQHNPTPPGFETGAGNAYETPMRDKEHGRIYRIVHQGSQPSKSYNLESASTDQRVEALGSDNLFWRRHAQRLLVEQGDRSALPALAQMASGLSAPETGNYPAAVHALWTMQGLGFAGREFRQRRLEEIAMEALGHPAPAVLKAASVLGGPGFAQAILSRGLIGDPDLKVRRRALLTWRKCPHGGGGALLVRSFEELWNTEDNWLNTARTIAAAAQDAPFLKAISELTGEDGAEREAGVNLIPNPSFEDVEGDQPVAWKPAHYSGEASGWLDTKSKTGDRSVALSSETGADFTWATTQGRTGRLPPLRVDQDREYREHQNGRGALFASQHPTDPDSRVTGTQFWTQVEVTNTGRNTEVGINCLIGGGASRELLGTTMSARKGLQEKPHPRDLGNRHRPLRPSWSRRIGCHDDSVFEKSNPESRDAVLSGLARLARG
jgi:hypothetical protein